MIRGGGRISLGLRILVRKKLRKILENESIKRKAYVICSHFERLVAKRVGRVGEFITEIESQNAAVLQVEQWRLRNGIYDESFEVKLRRERERESRKKVWKRKTIFFYLPLDNDGLRAVFSGLNQSGRSFGRLFPGCDHHRRLGWGRSAHIVDSDQTHVVNRCGLQSPQFGPSGGARTRVRVRVDPRFYFRINKHSYLEFETVGTRANK